MRSGWFWHSSEWELYQREYFSGRERPDEYKSSPLAHDHEFDDLSFEIEPHVTRVLDLMPYDAELHRLWPKVRKSYHSLIHRAEERYELKTIYADRLGGIEPFVRCHIEANGRVRSDRTFAYQAEWISRGIGLCIGAFDGARAIAAAYWILLNDQAYFASGPSVERGVQHAVIWASLKSLKKRGIQLVELGQVDGESEKERNIGHFKSGFAGIDIPFYIARKS